jgi:pimeloyl-ACP methyl ester carboxylesterase
VPVIKDLQAHDLPVLAPPNPLRGLAHDAEYIASYVSQIDGPVLLVGHSYGGAVISVAGASTPNAVGLVFVAAFALDEGESFAEIFAQFGETPLLSAVRAGTYPLPNGETAAELTIRPELYRPAFAADLPSEETEVLAVSQRPFAAIFDDRGAGGGVEDAAVMGGRGHVRQGHSAGWRAPHGQAGRRPDDRGRCFALDRALAAGCGGRAGPHGGRRDVGGPEYRLAAAARTPPRVPRAPEEHGALSRS